MHYFHNRYHYLYILLLYINLSLLVLLFLLLLLLILLLLLLLLLLIMFVIRHDLGRESISVLFEQHCLALLIRFDLIVERY